MSSGAAVIQWHLERLGIRPVPSQATIWRRLKTRGLVQPAPERAPRPPCVRFEFPAPNACWPIDFTHWSLRDGRAVVIVNVIDDHSRLCVASRAATTTSSKLAWQRSPTPRSVGVSQPECCPTTVSSSVPDHRPAGCSKRTCARSSCNSSIRDRIIHKRAGRSNCSTTPSKRSCVPIPPLVPSSGCNASSTTGSTATITGPISESVAAHLTNAGMPAPPISPGRHFPNPPTARHRAHRDRERLDHRLSLGDPARPGMGLPAVRAFVDNLDVAIFTTDARLIRTLRINPERRYQPLTNT